MLTFYFLKYYLQLCAHWGHGLDDDRLLRPCRAHTKKLQTRIVPMSTNTPPLALLLQIEKCDMCALSI